MDAAAPVATAPPVTIQVNVDVAPPVAMTTTFAGQVEAMPTQAAAAGVSRPASPSRTVAATAISRPASPGKTMGGAE